jgi:hypothetical protein
VRRRGFHIFLDIWFTGGGEVVRLTCQPPFTPRKIPGSYFCLKLSRPQRYSATARMRSIAKSNALIVNRSRYSQACSIASNIDLKLVQCSFVAHYAVLSILKHSLNTKMIIYEFIKCYFSLSYFINTCEKIAC